MIEKFKDAFKEEAAELLNNLENLLLELEDNPNSVNTVQAIFRTMHTIKGSSAMFGFEDISKFTHEIETIMDLLREGKFVPDREFIDLTLTTRDLIRTMLDSSQPLPADLHQESVRIIGEFKKHVAFLMHEPSSQPSESIGPPPQKHEATVSLENSGRETVYRIFFGPNPAVLKNGTRLLSLIEELSDYGQAEAIPHLDSIPALSEIAAETCYVSWDVLLTTNRSENEIRDVFMFVEDGSIVKIDKIAVDDDTEDFPVKKLGEILVERGVAKAETITAAMNDQKKLGEVLVERNVATGDQVKAALAEQDKLKSFRDKQSEETQTASVRVNSEKLDQLVDLVGELVTLQARLLRISGDTGESGLSGVTEQFDRLISQLRDNTMSMRMQPIGTSFSKFRRVVRDLSRDLGKEAELVTEGAETELDKTVIERLNDPLVHIIRNAVDHGLETPEIREQSNKDKKGTVTLSAKHSGAHVLIRIADDGAGLNREAILKKAVQKGLLASGQDVDEDSVFQLIFAPGFSTASTVTSVSGRGVGMDVVKREIDSLGGSVSIETVRNRGTTITLKIPLTLAIINGLLVRVGSEHFVIPLSSVEGCIELERKIVESTAGRIISYRGEALPFLPLREVFRVSGENQELSQVVIVGSHDSKLGLVVDLVIGDYQTVIKPLGRMFKSAEGVSGATILGDGTVALILDTNRLTQMMQRHDVRRKRESIHG